MPANILNLPQYRVLRVEETDHDYHVTAEPVDVASICQHCQSDRLISWGTREQVFKDLPMHGKRVGIYIDTKRLRCQACGKTFSQALPVLAENRMMTDRLVKWIGQQSLKRTFTSLADETGVVEGTIRNIFRDYINELEQTVRFETPKWMGIDGDRENNRYANLRQVTNQQNSFNAGIRKDSLSGVRGVIYNERREKWEAWIGFNGKTRYLGGFDSFDTAVEVRRKVALDVYGKYASEINR